MKDVVVIGGGPSGLHAAHQLALGGLDVALLESRHFIGEGAVCSGVIGEEAFARFALPTGAVITELRFIKAISPQGRTLEHKTDAPLARVVEKSEFNRALGQRAESAGVDIRLCHLVESVECEKDSVLLTVRNGTEERKKIRSRMAVIASGVNGGLTRKLGLARPTQLLKAMQADILMTGCAPSEPTEIYVGRRVAPGAFAWRIPMNSGRVRVGIMCTQDPKPYFRKLVQRVVPECEASGLTPCAKAIAQAPVGRCFVDRVVAIGEAAGHVKTSTGGGIYYGMMSAEFAGDVILRAFRKNDLTAAALSQIERYWRAAFGHELLVGFFARELAGRLPDAIIERIFASASASNFIFNLNGKLKFDWHHRALLDALRHWMLVPQSKSARL